MGIWVAFAVALPYLLRSKSLWLDAFGAAVWAGGLIAAQQSVATAAPAAAGAVLGAAAAVAARHATVPGTRAYVP